MDRRYVVVSVILVIVVISSFILFSILSNTDKGITAKEGVEKAYEIAKRWNKNAVLGSIRTIDSEHLNGKSSYWIYGFLDPNNNSHFIDVKVHSSGTAETYEYNTALNISYDPSLWKWNVDSTEAYEISLKNQEVKSFASKYGIDQIEYSLGEESPIWTVSLIDWGTFDNPHSIVIKIDASNGDVLYVGT